MPFWKRKSRQPALDPRFEPIAQTFDFPRVHQLVVEYNDFAGYVWRHLDEYEQRRLEEGLTREECTDQLVKAFLREHPQDNRSILPFRNMND